MAGVSSSRKRRKKSGLGRKKGGARHQDPDTVLEPKLRMVTNGSAEVNLLRAEHASALLVPTPKQAPQRGDDAEARRKATSTIKPKKLDKERAPSMVLANVFVDLREGEVLGGKFRKYARSHRNGLVAARVPLSEIKTLASQPGVARVELAQPLSDPSPLISSAQPRPPKRGDYGPAALHGDGQGVLVGIIDVQGFDFAHPDFLDENGDTRFVELWDQGGTVRGRPKDFPYHYGAVLDSARLNRALAASRRGAGAAATSLEPQSQMVPGSHGTHVASTAAGNTGVCPKAEIAGVLVSMGPEDLDSRKSFYDSTRIVHAVEYLVALAKRRKKLLTVNISLGTNGHAHDGSNAASRWLDSLLTSRGVAVSIAAGNAGQEAPETDGDIGYIMGRIHTHGRIPSRELKQDITWVVVGNGTADMSENEFELWYSSQDRFSVQVRTPEGHWTEVVKPGEFIENRLLSNGTFLSVYNELYHASNGTNYIAIYLSPPLLRSEHPAGVAPGEWTIRLTGLEVRDGTYHGWIERDDPRPVGKKKGSKELWNFPSFFAERSYVDKCSVSSLACGHNVISVANLDEMRGKVNITSSQGPTRDGRAKPDLCARGTDVVAAKGFSGGDDLWISMTGTSMASPLVAGVAGLMLAAQKQQALTAPQILGILRRTAKPLPGADFTWRDDAGYGVLDAPNAIKEAESFLKRKDVTR